MKYTSLSAKIADYIAERKKSKLEAFDKGAKKENKKKLNAEARKQLELELSEKRQKLEAHFDPANWLTAAALRAGQISFVTHPIKFSNPLLKGGSSCYCPGGDKQPAHLSEDEILSTASLCKLNIDVVGNAAALDVARFLQLEHAGKMLIDFFENNDPAPLKPFACNDNQLLEWLDSFSQVLQTEKLSSHKLAKQLYFPINEKDYHLLSPLYPSSLTQALDEKIKSSRFSENAKLVRKAKRESIFNNLVYIDFPETAVQSFGGANSQNVSLLNARRRGKAFLLSCAPPKWQTQTKPPFNVKTVFSFNHFSARTRKETWELRTFLEKQVDNESTFDIRRQRENLVERLVDHLFQYGAEIQNLKKYSGWSRLPECKLSLAEQLWLDPFRDDEIFIREREKKDWPAEVAENFAFWLNSRIKSKKLTLGDIEHREWKKLVEQRIRSLKEELEVFI